MIGCGSIDHVKGANEGLRISEGDSLETVLPDQL